MCKRKRSHRAKTVSAAPDTKHRSHAGKNEPRMSNEGALLHPAAKSGASRTAGRIDRPLRIGDMSYGRFAPG